MPPHRSPYLRFTLQTAKTWDARGPLDWAAQILGYESVDTTRIYLPLEQDLQRAVEKVALASC